MTLRKKRQALRDREGNRHERVSISHPLICAGSVVPLFWTERAYVFGTGLTIHARGFGYVESTGRGEAVVIGYGANGKNVWQFRGPVRDLSFNETHERFDMRDMARFYKPGDMPYDSIEKRVLRTPLHKKAGKFSISCELSA